jgi:hypothetical protein
MSIKEELFKMIKEKRPKLSDSSTRTYVSLLSTLYKKLEGEDKEFFEDHEKPIINYIKEMSSAQSRKTICSALFVLTEKPIYRALMMDDVKEVNDKYKTQKPNTDKIMRTFDEIKATHQMLLEKLKKNPSIDNYVNAIISYLSTGVLNDLPPRRLQDYAFMKTKGYDKDKEMNNYMDKKNFVFNVYKTHERYGTQTIAIPMELMTLIKKWKKINDSEYLLITDEKGTPFNPSSLSKRLTSLFGVSVDGLRSIYLSSVYKDMPKIEEMEKRAYQMGHSVSSALNYYVKKD